jgi:hypothetical protein
MFYIFFLLQDSKSFGTTSLGFLPSSHETYQKGVLRPFPKIIVVVAKKKNPNPPRCQVPESNPNFIGILHSSQGQQNLRAVANPSIQAYFYMTCA